MTERLDPVERVREYVEAIDAFSGSPSYGDVVHGLNFAVLRRSDLRTLLARLDVTEALVERAARAYWQKSMEDVGIDPGDWDESEREQYMWAARIVLEAALSVKAAC